MAIISNDEVSKVFDWLYIGGCRNIRKTLPLVDVWYDFRWDKSKPKNLVIPSELIVHNVPFDDGDLDAAKNIWKKCFVEIQKYKELNKKVLISCYEGVSRSAVLTLWLCCEEFGDYETALKHLKRCRNIHPDRDFNPFLDELKESYTSCK
ncbi:dual specificity protein phosphatase family protein [Bacillus cereus]|uniref:dual specificity protein phosphatase family protein n=1 Tax=Bacillus cereus TaxID=1396 RepID=UPI000B4BC7C6|nr:dual specificity protein phosphatase family protein [Bacillus cereus]